MAFPKLLQKLFQNSGAGSLLREDIIPVDSSLSTTSTNAVQNKVVKSAVDVVTTLANATGYQVGDLRLYAGSNVPDGWFRCDGSTVSNMATNYPLLYAVLGTNVLPNYSGKYPLGSSTEINSLVSAGLPNATGTYTQHGSGGSNQWGLAQTVSGAIYAITTASQTANLSTFSTSAVSNWGIDLSKSNAIFGASDTVTPPSVKVAVLIKHD